MAIFQCLMGRAVLRNGARDPQNNQLLKTIVDEGETVECDLPLDEMFANKWRRLDAPTMRAKGADHSLDNSGRTMDKPLHLRTKKELERAGHTNFAEPPLQGDKEALMGEARAGKTNKKVAKSNAVKNANATGFAVKAKDGGRRGATARTEEEDEEAFLQEVAEEESEDPKPKKKKKLKAKDEDEEPEEEPEEEETETEDEEEADEEADEDEEEEEAPPPPPKKIKKKMKSKKR